jgi:hypothetical protein
MSDKACPKCSGPKIVKTGTTESSGRQRYKCQDCGHRTTNPIAPEIPAVKFHNRLPGKRRYVITAAQNATPVFKPFLAALQNYCEANDAALIVIPYRYKNPTSQWNANNESYEWWDGAVLPHLYDGRFDLNNNLVVMADVKVQPTATSPLSGLDTMTGHKSGIVGHPRIELKTVATPSHKLPKLMTTTGAVTKPNYTDSKAGKKGDFHHSFGAVVVETDGSAFHLRQLIACRDGSFIDIDREYSADGVTDAKQAEAVILGDVHVDFADPKALAATFGARGMVPTLNPKRLVLHDLLDFYSRSHHHRADPFISVAKRAASMDVVRDEIERACDWINKHCASRHVILVPSNHVDALSKWVAETDWRGDPVNAETYLETALEMVRSIKMTPNGTSRLDPFHYWARKLVKTPSRVEYLMRGDAYSVRGIELSMHGDKGVNGARGSRKSMSTIGVKSVIGHSHSPGITDGCYQTGTLSRLKLEYNDGPSSWLQTNCVIYANGKRALINCIDGKWRA